MIEKDRFSTGKNTAIIRVVAPVQSGSQKERVKAPKIRGRKIKPAVLFGSVPPYNIVVEKAAAESGNEDPPYSLVQVSPWPPTLNEDNVTRRRDK